MRTREGKMVLFDVGTGAKGEFWPIDARTLLTLGSHTTEAPSGVAVVAEAELPEIVEIAPPAVPVLPPTAAPRRRRSPAEG